LQYSARSNSHGGLCVHTSGELERSCGDFVLCGGGRRRDAEAGTQAGVKAALEEPAPEETGNTETEETGIEATAVGGAFEWPMAVMDARLTMGAPVVPVAALTAHSTPRRATLDWMLQTRRRTPSLVAILLARSLRRCCISTRLQPFCVLGMWERRQEEAVRDAALAAAELEAAPLAGQLRVRDMRCGRRSTRSCLQLQFSRFVPVSVHCLRQYGPL
jgi:hypothetical protein